MNLRHLRVGWRTLVQEPAYSAAVIFGLGIGLAACLLLLGYVRYCWQYNAHVPGVDQVYIVKQRYNVAPNAPLFDQAPLFLRAAAGALPGVADASAYEPTRPINRPLTLRSSSSSSSSSSSAGAASVGPLQQLDGLTVLPGFVETMGVQALRGDLASALTQPDRFAITEPAALRLFGTVDAVGRTVQAEGRLLQVGAVLRAQPANTTVPFEALFGVTSVLVEPELRHEMLSGAQGLWGKLLIRVAPGTSAAAVARIAAALQQALDHSPISQNLKPEARQRLGPRKAMELSLAPLRYAYFDTEVGGNGISAPGERGDPAVVAALAAMALLIVALAAANYVNLSTVRVLRRQREIALRKVLGASARQIGLQFLAEAMLVAMLATALGLLIAWLLLPAFAALVERDLAGMFTPAYVAAALAGGAVLGLATAAYPAWIALRVRPATVLAGRPDGESRRSLRWRRALTVAQVATAMALASFALAIAWQTAFALHASPGFDAAPLLVVDLPQPVRSSEPARRFMSALAARPGIAGVAISEDAVGRQTSSWFHELKRPGGSAAMMDMKSVSANFFTLYRIPALAGRLFDAQRDAEDDAAPVVLDAIATRELGFATPQAALDATVLFTGGDGKLVRKHIVGIAPQLRFHTLHEAPRATAYELWTAGTTLTVRAAADTATAERAVRALWLQYFPDTVLSLRPARQILDANYAEEARLARLMGAATAIALAIAAFGTYALSATTVQRRAREIVLRKLHGARRADIGWLVVREIGALMLAAAAIGLPLAAVAIGRYLATYVVQAPAGYWSLLLALALTLATALGAIARHTWLATRLMAADALRS